MTTITLPRAVVEQALEAMRRAVPTGKITLYEWDRAISDLSAALAMQRLTDAQQKMERSIESLKAALAQQAEPVEPVAWRFKTDAWFDGNVWHDAYEVTTDKSVAEWRGRGCVTPLYTAPPQRKPLTDEEILDAVGWERAEMYMKLTPNFPVDEAKKETLKNARAVERKVRGDGS